MKTPIPQLLHQVAQAYEQALRSVKIQHGEPVRTVTHHFTTTLFYLGSDGAEDLVIEIEPDPAAGEVRILAVQFTGNEDGNQLYVRTKDAVNC